MMLPRLAAEETLDASTAVGLGTGSYKDGKAVTRNLMKVASAGRSPRRSTASPAALEMMGIKVEMVGSSDG
jgi:hypothetical protein